MLGARELDKRQWAAFSSSSPALSLAAHTFLAQDGALSRAECPSFFPNDASASLARDSWSAFFSTALKWFMDVAYLVYSVLMLAWEVGAGVLGVAIVTPEIKALKGQLAAAQTYSEWRVLARMLDELDGYDVWRREESSPFFNFEGVMRTMQELAELKRNGDANALLQVLLCRLHRSLYGVNNSQLYLPYLTGTKSIIHSYTSLMCFLIRDLVNDSIRQQCDADANALEGVETAVLTSAPAHSAGKVQQPQNASLQAPPANATVAAALPPPPQRLYEALEQIRRVYGSTALVLNGGGPVAPLHLGAAKALYDANLLPQVIYGCRSGALVAALLCCHEDLSEVMNVRQMNDRALAGKDRETTIMQQLQRLRQKGHMMDVNVVMRFMKDSVGEVTFMEAYQRTGRILNIQYPCSFQDETTGRRQRCSCLLNYLTAPDVLVYTAAASSLGSVPVMFASVPLLARDFTGAVAEYDPAVLVRGYPQCLSDDAGCAPETSLHRLRELFHVQYFIVTDCSSLMKPTFLRHQEHRGGLSLAFVGVLYFYIAAVVRFFWWVLCQTPLEPYLVTALDNDVAECGMGGDAMVLSPHLRWRDLYSLWGFLSPSEMQSCVLASERQVWPRLEEIRMGQAIEHAIADALQTLREGHFVDERT